MRTSVSPHCFKRDSADPPADHDWVDRRSRGHPQSSQTCSRGTRQPGHSPIRLLPRLLRWSTCLEQSLTHTLTDSCTMQDCWLLAAADDQAQTTRSSDESHTYSRHGKVHEMYHLNTTPLHITLTCTLIGRIIKTPKDWSRNPFAGNPPWPLKVTCGYPHHRYVWHYRSTASSGVLVH